MSTPGVIASGRTIQTIYQLYFRPKLDANNKNNVIDHSGNSNVGTIGGASYTTWDGAARALGTTSNIHNSTYVPFCAIFRWVPTGENAIVGKWLITGGNKEILIDCFSSRINIFLSEDGVAQNYYTPDDIVDDGEWHVLTGTFDNGVLSGTVDGNPFSFNTVQQSIYNGTAKLSISGYNDGGSGRFSGDLAYVCIGNYEYHMSSCWESKIYEESGGPSLDISFATFANLWNRDADGIIYPRNFERGFYLYENTVIGEEVRTPYQLDVGDIPAGYSYSGYYPPLRFGFWEGWLKLTYNENLALADENNVFFTGTTSNEIDYDILNTTDLGSFIKKKIDHINTDTTVYENIAFYDTGLILLISELGEILITETGEDLTIEV